MKVKNLIELLQKEDPESLVVCRRYFKKEDDHSPLGCIWGKCAYDQKTGKIGLQSLTDRQIELGYTDKDLVPDGEPAVLLIPMD
jgi:hypothetical protein